MAQPQNDAVSRIMHDSRLIQPGDLFVALSAVPEVGTPGGGAGESVGPHGVSYLAKAWQAGARAAIAPVDHALCASLKAIGEQPEHSLTLYDSADSWESLWRLGQSRRSQFAGKTIAITGSSGKTTARSMLAHILEGYESPGNFNNHLGVPLSLSNLPLDAQWAIIEVGTSSPGEIAPLSRRICPDVAILLNVHLSHVGNFESTMALTNEKMDIFSGLDQNKGIALRDAGTTPDYKGSLTFGSHADADSRVVQLLGDRADIDLFGQRIKVYIPGGGKHRAETISMIALLVHALGRPLSDLEKLETMSLPRGRGAMIEVGHIQIIDDSYNAASPISMLEGLALEQQITDVTGRKHVLLGAMLELGERTAQAHELIAAKLSDFDQVFLVGEAWQDIAKENGFEYSLTADQALLDRLAQTLCAGDRLYVKGSNSIFWKHNFVDRLIALLGN